MFLHLPVEILLAIGEQLANLKDIKTLCELSTYLYKVFTPLLYKRLTLWPSHENLLDNIDVEPFLRTSNTANNLLRHTKSIHFKSTFYFNTRGRCVPVDEWHFHLEQRDIDELPFSFTSFASLLEGCRDDSLRDFCWNMGTCIPGRLLGYLSRKQKSIESLVLVTNGACAYNYDQRYAIDISAFLCLRKLSWSGIRSVGDMNALKVSLKHVAHQLVKLELDFMNKNEMKNTLSLDADELDNFFSHHILELPDVSTTRMFPAVRVLSFSNIPFGSNAQIIADAFAWGSLNSLTLRFCDGWENFLLCGSVSSCPIGIKSLKLQSTLGEEIDADVTIATFLGSFQGLEELFLSHGSPASTLVIWNALVHHQATLTTFVHHQRGLHDEGDLEDLEDFEDFEEYDSDSPDLSLPMKEIMTWLKDKMKHPLSGLELEYLGLCCHPELLLTHVLKPLTTNTSIRILHLRQSGSDVRYFGSWGIQEPYDEISSELYSLLANRVAQVEGADKHRASKLTQSLQDLAQWAFGSEGLLSLQVIAYGDFSYERRYPGSQVLLVRNAGQGDSEHGVDRRTFRHMLPVDSWQKDLIDSWSHVLAACPSSPLLEDWVV
ncbi:hypothetical protein BKA63DRAFT_67729 [Paraphoma chrysanthemicola]|nr:hypothetical protein BKA63DRAFT_67729 [Paraphoma chrysanthemicola]